MSNLTGVTNFFSTANEGFATTLLSTASAGATTLLFAQTAGLTDGSVFVGIIEPGGVNQQVFTGTVSLTTGGVINVIWTRGTNVNHAGGVTIVDYVTGTDFNMTNAGIRVEHQQSGQHGDTHHLSIHNAGTLTNTGAATIAGLLTASAGLSIPSGQPITLDGNSLSIVTGSDGASGTANYFLLGPIMVAFGVTQRYTNGTASAAANFSRAFSATPTLNLVSLYVPNISGNQVAFILSAASTTSLQFGINNASGNAAASSQVSWLVIGAA